MIIIATGTYDINIAGSIEIDKNVILTSISEFTAAIINTHASATGIFKVTEETIFSNLSLRADNNITAIEFSGVNTGGSRLDNVIISSITASSAHTLIKLTNGANGIISNHLRLVGNVSNTTGIDMEANATNSIWQRLEINNCLLGLKIQTGGVFHIFDDLFAYTCTSGVEIASGTFNIILKNINLEDCTTEITDNGTSTTINRPIEIDSLAGIEGFTEVLYVSPDGDNSDGKSWAGAINLLWDAIQLANSSSNHMTLILCAPATYDINITGDPDVNRNVTIRGIGGTQGVGVSIKNDHAGATSVLKFTKIGGLFNLGINLGTSNNGIIWSGADAVQGRMENIDVVMAGLTSAKTGVIYEDCAFHTQQKVYYIGETTYSTGLVFNNCQYYIDFENLVLDCLVGINSIHSDDDYLVFRTTFVNGCVTGVKIDDSAEDFILDHVHFVNNTTNVTADPTADVHILHPIVDKKVIEMYPTTSNTPVNVSNGGAAAGVYGSYVTIIAADIITKPFSIIGIAVDGVSDGNAMYFLELVWGDSDIVIGVLPIRGAVGISSPQSPPIESGIIPENSRIRGRIQTSNGGADTIDIFIQLVPF